MIGEILIIIGVILFVVLVNICVIYSIVNLNLKEDYPIIILFIMIMSFVDGIVLLALGI